MSNISPTVKVNISQNLGKVKENSLGETCSREEIKWYTKLLQEYRDIFAWDYSEMLGLSPTIIENHIDTWPDIPPTCQKQRQLHPSKEEVIKREIDNIHKAGFVYPISYTSWVSNPISIMKRQGMIHNLTDFLDLNKACPKENYPTPFINQVIDSCAGHETLSFMDGFSRYNQIQI